MSVMDWSGTSEGGYGSFGTEDYNFPAPAPALDTSGWSGWGAGLAEMPNLGRLGDQLPAGTIEDFVKGAGGPATYPGQGNLVNVGGMMVNRPPTPSPTDLAGKGEGGSSTGSTIAKWAQPVSQMLGGVAAISQIPLTLAGLNISKQGQKIQQNAANTAQAAAGPAVAAEAALLPAGTKALMTGQLPPELEAQVEQQVNQVKQTMLQQLVNQGIDPATAESMIADQLTQLKTNLTIQMANSLLQGGSASASGATWGAGTAGNIGGAQYSTANQSLLQSQQALMRLLGSAA